MRHFLANLFGNLTKTCAKTVGGRSDFDDVVRGALILQTVFGQQILHPNWTWKQFCKRFTFSLILFIYVIFGTLDVLQNTTEEELIAEACYTLIMTGIFPIKLLLFIINKDIFRELYVQTKSNLLKAIEQTSDVKQTMVVAKRIVKVLFIVVTIPVMNLQFLCLWGYVTNNKAPLSRSTSILMPTKFPYYEIAWVLHSIFLVEISTTVILDMWFVLLIFLLCAANDSLVEVLKVEKRREGESKLLYGRRLRENLKVFYHNHVIQAKFLNTMNKMYKWLAFVPLCNAAMCVCIILLLLSKDLNWKFAPHFLPMFAEIFVYNYFGEQIKTKATRIKEALLNFDWTSLPREDRKTYIIIITYTKKNFGIKTALGSDLSLINMTSVLQVTYRAFTMLQSV